MHARAHAAGLITNYCTNYNWMIRPEDPFFVYISESFDRGFPQYTYLPSLQFGY